MPPQAICDAYKKYQRMSDLEVNNDLEIVDFNRGLSPGQQEKMSPVGIVPSELIAEAQKEFMNAGAEYDPGHPEPCTIYEHSEFPGKLESISEAFHCVLTSYRIEIISRTSPTRMPDFVCFSAPPPRALQPSSQNKFSRRL